MSDEDNSDAEWEETLIRRGAITEEALKPLQQATSDGSVLGNAIEEARRSASIVNAAQALKSSHFGLFISAFCLRFLASSRRWHAPASV